MFWLSISLSLLLSGYTVARPVPGIAWGVIALVLAGNAFVRLQRGQPTKSPTNVAATWVALAAGGLALALGILRQAT